MYVFLKIRHDKENRTVRVTLNKIHNEELKRSAKVNKKGLWYLLIWYGPERTQNKVYSTLPQQISVELYSYSTANTGGVYHKGLQKKLTRLRSPWSST